MRESRRESHPRRQPVWKSILEMSDRLAKLRLRLAQMEDEAESLEEVQEAVQEALTSLRRQIVKDGLTARLNDLAHACQGWEDPPVLDDEDALFIAVGFQQYLSGKTRWIKGREFLELLYAGSYERLCALPRLSPRGALLASGLLTVETPAEPSEEADPLEQRFRVADHLLRADLDSIVTGDVKVRPPSRPPLSDLQLLLRMKEIIDLSSQRGQRVFERDEGSRPLNSQELLEIEALSERIEALQRQLQQHLEELPDLCGLRLLEFRREFSLSWDEWLIVCCLLLSEGLQGEPYVHSIHLLRLVATDEGDMWHKRGLFAPDRTLVREGIVQMEEMIEGRSLTAEIALSTWVVKRLTSQSPPGSQIPSDEQIDFHVYLRNLGDSASFFRDIGGSSVPPRERADTDPDRRIPSKTPPESIGENDSTVNTEERP